MAKLSIKILALLFLTFILSIVAHAQSPGRGRFGLGAQIGAPTAITGKYFTKNDEAIDFGFGFWSSHWSLVYSDYHWGFPGLFGHRSKFVSELLPYMGVGAGLAFWSDHYDCGRWSCDRGHDSGTAFFARVPFGVEWFPSRPPLGVFLELVPSITIIPGTSGGFDFGLGGRFYF